MTQKLSRRDALKVLGAAAGATALANLPSKWTTPKLEAGLLPAHAATSCVGAGATVETSQQFLFSLRAGPPPASTVLDGGSLRTWDTSQCGCLLILLINFLEGPISVVWSVGSDPAHTEVIGSGDQRYIAINLTTGQGCAKILLADLNGCAASFGCGPFVEGH